MCTQIPVILKLFTWWIILAVLCVAGCFLRCLHKTMTHIPIAVLNLLVNILLLTVPFVCPSSLSWYSRPQKLRWPSFQNSHRPSLASAPLQISCQSVLQMNRLQKLSLLKLTALLESHTPTNKHGFSWWVYATEITLHDHTTYKYVTRK